MSLYSLLGVAPSASPAEIERAYLRLVRRYHPGINPGDRVAAEMYRQIQDAYEVLADPDRRRDYDRGHTEPVTRVEAEVSFEGFDFSAPAEGPLAATFSELFADVFQQAAREATTPSRGADVGLTVEVPFVDAMRGGAVTVSLTRRERCPSCGGAGRVSRLASVCHVCRGEGSRRWARGHMVFTKACETCGGEGRLQFEPCRGCQGVGIIPRTEVLTVPIPVGVDDGTRIAVPGHGDAGAFGGPAGDLYVTVRVIPHPYFSRAGRDLQVTVPVAVHEAALGAVIEVPSVDGPKRVRIPAGAAGGQRLTVPGAGVGAGTAMAGDAPGDLVVTLQIVLPERLDDRSRALLQEFGRLNDQDVRRDLFGSAEVSLRARVSGE
jgi:molecular chaperone DnaJ